MQKSGMRSIRVVDSHSAGEPTRVVLDGGPDLGAGLMSERVEVFRKQHDRFRSAVVMEPRGSEAWVGALLTPPTDPTCATGVIFFNNVGYLKMCGHGMIGVVMTLAHLGRLQPGEHRIETPAGLVTATLHKHGEVSVLNVPSYRHAKQVTIDVPGLGQITGDVAWGGNWFFLMDQHGQELKLSNIDRLTDFSWRVRQTLEARGITGAEHGEIDHIELFGPPTRPGAHSKNFVLCPGKAYDRSPCGTGTSAKLACLAADGKLAEGESWVQESILGSCFSARYQLHEDKILPTITGTAHVNAESTLILNPADPFCWGIRA